jgi:hypothetical protein
VVFQLLTQFSRIIELDAERRSKALKAMDGLNQKPHKVNCAKVKPLAAEKAPWSVAQEKVPWGISYAGGVLLLAQTQVSLKDIFDASLPPMDGWQVKYELVSGAKPTQFHRIVELDAE